MTLVISIASSSSLHTFLSGLWYSLSSLQIVSQATISLLQPASAASPAFSLLLPHRYHISQSFLLQTSANAKWLLCHAMPLDIALLPIIGQYITWAIITFQYFCISLYYYYALAIDMHWWQYISQLAIDSITWPRVNFCDWLITRPD